MAIREIPLMLDESVVALLDKQARRLWRDGFPPEVVQAWLQTAEGKEYGRKIRLPLEAVTRAQALQRMRRGVEATRVLQEAREKQCSEWMLTEGIGVRILASQIVNDWCQTSLEIPK